MKRYYTFIAIIFCIIAGAWLFQKNIPLNTQTTLSIHDAIYLNAHHSLTIGSFLVNYCEHVPLNGLNPNFPAIHIATRQPHNAWLHVVHTDAIDPETGKLSWTFVDSNKNIFPLYSLENDFYDAPHWNFSRWHMPLTYWKGHAYAVTTDPENGKLSCTGGIEWGFTLNRFSLIPTTVHPKLLTLEDWQSDWKQVCTNIHKHNLQTLASVKTANNC